jgi:hypothetical protein
MFVEMLKIGSRIEELVQATPPYQVSPAMEVSFTLYYTTRRG